MLLVARQNELDRLVWVGKTSFNTLLGFQFDDIGENLSPAQVG